LQCKDHDEKTQKVWPITSGAVSLQTEQQHGQEEVESGRENHLVSSSEYSLNAPRNVFHNIVPKDEISLRGSPLDSDIVPWPDGVGKMIAKTRAIPQVFDSCIDQRLLPE